MFYTVINVFVFINLMCSIHFEWNLWSVAFCWRYSLCTWFHWITSVNALLLVPACSSAIVCSEREVVESLFILWWAIVPEHSTKGCNLTWLKLSNIGLLFYFDAAELVGGWVLYVKLFSFQAKWGALICDGRNFCNFKREF